MKSMTHTSALGFGFPSILQQPKILIISIYQSNQYQVSHALISSRNLRYPKLLVDFQAKVKMTGSARAKNKKGFTLYCFFENKLHFYQIILVNSKTTIPSGSVPSARYIARRFTSRYISTTIHLPCGGQLLNNTKFNATTGGHGWCSL